MKYKKQINFPIVKNNFFFKINILIMKKNYFAKTLKYKEMKNYVSYGNYLSSSALFYSSGNFSSSWVSCFLIWDRTIWCCPFDLLMLLLQKKIFEREKIPNNLIKIKFIIKKAWFPHLFLINILISKFKFSNLQPLSCKDQPANTNSTTILSWCKHTKGTKTP